MMQEDQRSWEAQLGTGTDERTEKDRGHGTEKEGNHSKYDWEEPSGRSRHDPNSDLFGDEGGGELFGDEDGGQKP
jgi:hypothetical protein